MSFRRGIDGAGAGSQRRDTAVLIQPGYRRSDAPREVARDRVDSLDDVAFTPRELMIVRQRAACRTDKAEAERQVKAEILRAREREDLAGVRCSNEYGSLAEAVDAVGRGRVTEFPEDPEVTRYLQEQQDEHRKAGDEHREFMLSLNSMTAAEAREAMRRRGMR